MSPGRSGSEVGPELCPHSRLCSPGPALRTTGPAQGLGGFAWVFQEQPVVPGAGREGQTGGGGGAGWCQPVPARPRHSGSIGLELPGDAKARGCGLCRRSPRRVAGPTLGTSGTASSLGNPAASGPGGPVCRQATAVWSPDHTPRPAGFRGAGFQNQNGLLSGDRGRKRAGLAWPRLARS